MPADLPPWLLQQRRDIGRRIRELRIERGLSQETLSEQAGIDRKTVNRTELGELYNASVEVLLLIAHALDVPPDRLFRNAD